MEKSEMPSLEEIAKIKDERILSDAELIKGGASHIPTEQGGLELTARQKDEAKMEHEGELYPDVVSYVKMNKEIIVPAEEVPEEIKKEIGTGWLTSENFSFIDQEGNFVQIMPIFYDKISSIAGKKREQEQTEQFKKELEDAGFSFRYSMPFDLVKAIDNYQKKVSKANEASRKEKFDF